MADGFGGARAVAVPATTGSGRVLAIMYHDVLAGPEALSGFPGNDADIYKLAESRFREHLEAMRAAGVTVGRDPAARGPGIPVILTFDDGGVSAADVIGGMLEEYGWRGHFFVPTGQIGRPGFLDERQIRELAARGHTIGSHSATHPVRISSLSHARLLREWGDSVERLSDIIGERVSVASVPGGYYSRRVAEAAAESGIRVLFNSEPTMRTYRVDGCLIVGRYVATRSTTPRAAARLALGRRLPRWRQALLWQAKKVFKATAGGAYDNLRYAMFGGVGKPAPDRQ